MAGTVEADEVGALRARGFSVAMLSNMQSFLPSLLVATLLSGCAASSESRECNVGADCVSGACSSSGMCLQKTADGGVDTGPVVTIDSGMAADTDAEPVDAPKVGCSPNKDSVITAEEVPVAAGLKATFRVAENAAFATAGTANPDGTRKWDLSIALAGDRDVLITTRALTGTWYGPKFPGASHSTELSTASDLLGVFQTTAAGLLLMGVVSPTESATKTELKYATPPSALQFPLKVAAAWKVTSNVNGTASGIFTAFTETWDAKVDQKGEIVTPFATFPVLRVRTILTRNVGLTSTVTRSFAFVTECYGTVATVTSKANETQEEFTTAAEIRRLTP